MVRMEHRPWIFRARLTASVGVQNSSSPPGLNSNRWFQAAEVQLQIQLFPECRGVWSGGLVWAELYLKRWVVVYRGSCWKLYFRFLLLTLRLDTEEVIVGAARSLALAGFIQSGCFHGLCPFDCNRPVTLLKHLPRHKPQRCLWPVTQ